MKIHVGDTVLVTTGKDKKKTGKVTRVSTKHSKVIVEKVNLRTKHIKKRQGQPGQKVRFEAAINASNVAVICPSCSKATRVGYVMVGTGDMERKQRVCKKCNQSLDTKVERKKTKKK